MSKPTEPDSFAALFESAPRQVGWRKCKVGDVLDLEVVRVGHDTVLVALDGKQEGVIDLPELLGPDGKPTVSVGSRVAVRVVEIERSSGTVRLSPVSIEPIVQALTDGPASPAAAPGAAVVAGMRVRGKVSAVERYGVFLEFTLAGESRSRRGLVPVAELGAPRGADLRKGFPVGKELEAAVAGVDERGRIRLSVTALRAAEERKAYETYAAAGREESGGGGGDRPRSDKDAQRGAGFGTLGDLLKQGRRGSRGK